MIGAAIQVPADTAPADAAPADTARPRLRLDAAPGEGRRGPMTPAPLLIGVADDDAAIRDALRELLESAGHLARLHPDGAALLASPDFDRFDCLVADICMPGMDGGRLEALARARRPGLPVILVTGDHDLADRLAARGRPPGLLFRKPFDGQALLTAIETEALRRPGRG